ncbi:DUF2019 domain-containing protein [Azorhizobium doebereinerae]|uniref:DUF2019 domain-containing protein n=1 Tax=Azorhizobium doebereinerae TaxID=281091 RepID=UPI0003F78D7B|nr:DUF2019 domain-containing protein [Azorhizobium doebereinerae]
MDPPKPRRPARKPLKRMSTEELFDFFIDRSLEMKRADDWMENGAYNRAHKIVRDIREELKQRPGDQRHALLPLLAHRNIQVRLNAAIATLALSPAAEEALKGIAPLGYCAQAIDAANLLKAMAAGRYKPS